MDFELAGKIEDIIDGDQALITNNDHTLSTNTEKSPFIENKPPNPYPKVLDNKYFAPIIGLIVVLVLILIVIFVVMFSDEASQTKIKID
ncbi:MAG: hypothetical protein ACRCZI_08380 [Cetobacterium sp.]